ncbi:MULTISPECIES: NAD(P)H-hydrate dehydratase [Ramlibacter]|uniref:ADP-dependent (S)-NAD(P)H-hydrate dehydratase n=1 Tax=Ramlibacter pinisoli TaxID=2682844 RepID=A0A6N8J130_9BURK|nr:MULTISPECIES: NAD(P)H-hydrate dehydratase [Ramlibacter]MBA2962603.1 NAD(P)H-hydrate dehydratase [Ramlibacter sp. CGMCC 1.13660]MVQ32545.1 NAD(P)H-hydrate dehydratase [Ramlibacter pinisoli]
MTSTPPLPLDAGALRDWPLPALSDDADKEARGQLLVVAGSREIPGAALLAATAALRMGAGKLVIATGESVATGLALAMPEARVIGLPETPAGGFRLDGIERLEASLEGANAILVGPGMMETAATAAFARGLLPLLAGRRLVLDAAAMDAAMAGPFPEPVLLTPHAGEMAHLTGAGKQAVLADPATAAWEAARRWNAVVAVKGAATVLATPDGRCWRHEGGNCGLATSGSGDTLAGAIAGLCARGATLEQACAWGVVLHAQAGDRLAARRGAVGYLAREIPDAMLEALNAIAG